MREDVDVRALIENLHVYLSSHFYFVMNSGLTIDDVHCGILSMINRYSPVLSLKENHVFSLDFCSYRIHIHRTTS